MARRSPLNPRYQRDTEPAGKTRRSASSAKPKREAGQQSAPSGKPAGKPDRPSLREAMRDVPSTPEMKRWQRLWWVCMGAAVAMLVLTLVVPVFKTNTRLGFGALLIYAAFLGGGLYIQLVKIKPLRDKAIADAKAGKNKKKDGKAQQ